MKLLSIIFALVIMAFMSFSCAEDDENVYKGEIIPLEIGNCWRYSVEYFSEGDSFPDFEYIQYISDTATINDTFCHVVEIAMEDSSIIRKELWSHLNDHIYRIGIIDEGDTMILRPLESIIKYPVSFGDRFFVDTLHTYFGDIDSLFWTVTKLDVDINTPAGEFDCIEYYYHNFSYSEVGGNIDTVFNEIWLYFAPDFGVIAKEASYNQSPHYKEELIEFLIE
ncbi:MAG: hypothetical protein ACLFSQ_02470 [Candidatus Zixiibacteriota bacterium]